MTGTLHLHEYVTGTLTRPNRPPACVMLPGSDSPVTPRVAEAKAGREARKNWKVRWSFMFAGLTTQMQRGPCVA